MVSDEEFKRLKARLEKLEKAVFVKKTAPQKFGKKSIMDQLKELKAENFFSKPKFLREIGERLAEKGYHYPLESLTEPLQRAVRRRILGRIKKDRKWAYVKR
jgi:hypothetical protein